MAELIAEENKVMMMDPKNMDVFTREWWDYARMEILARRRGAVLARTAEAVARAAASGGSGADASASGGGGDGGGGVDDTATVGGA
jgi:hypothetical protein